MRRLLFLLTFFTIHSSFLVESVNAQNPYLPLWEHIPDGEPRVFDDPDNPGKKRIYIIGSHDTNYDRYCGLDVRMWSAPVEDLSQWRDEGSLYKHYVNGQWDIMYAPDLVETIDRTTGKKTYWLYPHSRGWRRVATVCKSDRPDGPFTEVNLNADGTACLDGSLIDFDPSVFVEPVNNKKDKDYAKGYRAYVFYGFQHSTAFELDPDNMWAVRPGTEIHDYFIPASHRYGEVRDPEGTQYPSLYKGQNPGDFNFFEASSIRQVGNKYIMVFSGHSGPDYGLGSSNSTLRYAFGDSPLGPWRSGGVLVDSRGPILNEDGSHITTSNSGHNTHGSLQEINGQWYVFYHRPPRGYGFARQEMVAPVKIVCDKKPVAKGGIVRITGYDPFVAGNEWTAKASDGQEYLGAEVTSEGFQIFGLPPYAYYTAGIACHLSNQQWLQDNYDVWRNGMTLAGLTNGGVVGFKYFGFGGLAENTKGCNAFEGTKAGDGTQINIFLTPRSDEAFKIRVMLDGPYINNVWNGKEIAVIDVAGKQKGKALKLTAKVPAVEGLSGKHGIYLIVDGPEIQAPQNNRGFNRQQQNQPAGLCDIEGMGFSKNGTSIEVPKVPTVDILVDGKKLIMPANPIFSSQQNGYTEVNRYQVYGKLSGNSKITVKPSNPSIKAKVGKIADGRATVTCTWNGVDKIFLIN